ncbi:MAG: CPBP family intramembrane glutamic endopeptidase [Terracidiphilus sp.]
MTHIELQSGSSPGPAHDSGRAGALVELGVCYALILITIWTARPLQRWLYWTALAWVVVTTIRSFHGWQAYGFRRAGFWRAAWVLVVAAVLSAIGAATAHNFATLHTPHGPAAWVRTFGGYTVWSLMQQFLLQGYFLLRILRFIPNPRWAALTAASLFALAHLPNPILTPVTLLWGIVACTVFLRARNIYPLALAHAIFGISIAVMLPPPVIHNMRVGLGYVRYRAPRPLHLSQSDHTVSTVACVMADAPTRFSARQARP